MDNNLGTDLVYVHQLNPCLKNIQPFFKMETNDKVHKFVVHKLVNLEIY